MQFRQLEYLVALSREKHFTRAAEACSVSQPALSEAIRKLEIELDLMLIVRGRKFEGFTGEGERVARWAERILSDQTSLLQEAASLRSGVTGTVRLGVIPTATATAADLTAPLCARYPLVTVRLAEDLASTDIMARIDRFELDGGITYLDADLTSQYRTFPLYRERYVLLTADEPAIPRRTEITWLEASMLPMCALPSMMRGRTILDECFADVSATHTAQVETDSVASLYAHVRTGRWAAVVPHAWIVVFGEPPGLRYTPLLPGHHAPVIGLITRSDGPSSVLVRVLETTAEGLDRT